MNYVNAQGNIEVFDDRGEVWYVNDSVKQVNVFENGNIVVEDDMSVALVSPRAITVLTDILDCLVIESFLFVVDRKGSSVCGYIYSDDFEEESRLMLVDGTFWILYTSLLSAILPFAAFEVTGYSGGKLHGYKRNRKMIYDVKSRSYAPVKTISTNLIDALQSRIIEED